MYIDEALEKASGFSHQLATVHVVQRPVCALHAENDEKQTKKKLRRKEERRKKREKERKKKEKGGKTRKRWKSGEGEHCDRSCRAPVLRAQPLHLFVFFLAPRVCSASCREHDNARRGRARGRE